MIFAKYILDYGRQIVQELAACFRRMAQTRVFDGRNPDFSGKTKWRQILEQACVQLRRFERLAIVPG